MRNFVDENPLGCRRTRAILTRHDEHRHELIVHNLHPSSLLHDALFASSNPSPLHRTDGQAAGVEATGGAQLTIRLKKPD